MWYSMMTGTLLNESLPLTSEHVMKQFKLMETNGDKVNLSDTKRYNVGMVVQHTPSPVVEIFCCHLQDRVWSESALNAEIVIARELRKDYCPAGCVGSWTRLLTNSDEVAAGTACLLLKHWEKNLPAPQQVATKRELAAARPKTADLEKLQIASALWFNWMKPGILERDGRILPAMEQKFWNLEMTDSCARVAQGRYLNIVCRQPGPGPEFGSGGGIGDA
jgi:hypothetical protein